MDKKEDGNSCNCCCIFECMIDCILCFLFLKDCDD